MAETFPFGNSMADRDQWLGGPSAKSARYLVSYEGNFSLICGYHSFIFLGLDNLRIGIVSLTGCGPSVGVPIGKILGFGADTARQATRIENMYDTASDIRAVDGHIDLQAQQDGYASGMQLYAKMEQGIPQFLNVHIPFSFHDLNGSPGGVAGAEVEAVGSASMYWIDGYTGVIGDLMFGQTPISNAGSGLVSASLGGLIGAWSVDTAFNLYTELGTFVQAECLMQNSSPSYATPYGTAIPGVHHEIAKLPPFGCNVALEP